MAPAQSRRVISVMIVDDHAMFREAMSVALSQYPRLSVVCEAASGEEALTILREASPDIVLMDISMPGMNGIEAIRRALQIRPMSVIALSMHEREPYEAAAKAAGAKAYALKAEPVAELVRLIEDVAGKGTGDVD